MNIKEAMDDLYICATGAKYNTPTLGVGYYEKCWETVLNELDKKDKVIDMMAEKLYRHGFFVIEPVKKYDVESEIYIKSKTKEEIKEYFYNKIGG